MNLSMPPVKQVVQTLRARPAAIRQLPHSFLQARPVNIELTVSLAFRRSPSVSGASLQLTLTLLGAVLTTLGLHIGVQGLAPTLLKLPYVVSFNRRAYTVSDPHTPTPTSHSQPTKPEIKANRELERMGTRHSYKADGPREYGRAAIIPWIRLWSTP